VPVIFDKKEKIREGQKGKKNPRTNVTLNKYYFLGLIIVIILLYSVALMMSAETET